MERAKEDGKDGVREPEFSLDGFLHHTRQSGYSINVRVRLRPFYLILHNLFHSLFIILSLANPVFIRS